MQIYGTLSRMTSWIIVVYFYGSGSEQNVERAYYPQIPTCDARNRMGELHMPVRLYINQPCIVTDQKHIV